MILTKEWQPYNGDYEKKMQDIKLKNGTVLLLCWPNAGKWCNLSPKNPKEYDGIGVDNAEVAEVRLTHEED